MILSYNVKMKLIKLNEHIYISTWLPTSIDYSQNSSFKEITKEEYNEQVDKFTQLRLKI